MSFHVQQSPCRSQPTFLQQAKFTNHVSKCKDPPRYEDAVKQTRSMLKAVQVPNKYTFLVHTIPYPLYCLYSPQTCTGLFFSLQGPTAASQQMDDLFDVLIESGGEKYFNFLVGTGEIMYS